MNRIFMMLIFLIYANTIYSQQQVTYDALRGVWAYFYITEDYFTKDKVVATEQRLFFQDTQNVTLTIVAKDKEYAQNTSYRLKYSLSLRDSVPYLSLFSTESKQVLGAYIRVPLDGSLEMAEDPGFTRQKQLYQRKNIVVEPIISISTNTNISNQ